MNTPTNTTTSSELHVAERWEMLFDHPRGLAALERVLAPWIAERRWYRSKTKNVQSARIVAAFPMTLAPRDTARVALVELSLDDGAREAYVVPLAFVTGDAAARFTSGRPQAVVAPLRVTASGSGEADRIGLVVDALAHEPFLSEVLSAMARGVHLESGSLVMRFHGLPALVAARGAATAPRPIDREQTNTSVLFGDRFVGKIVRKLDPGEGADLEVGRFLTAAEYPYTPALAGWIDVAEATDGAAPSTVGIVHAFVPNRGDAWEHALTTVDAFLVDAARGRPRTLPDLGPGGVLARARRAVPEEVVEAMGEYGRLAERLGDRIGRMHVALASRDDDPQFRPEPIDRATLEARAESIRSDLSRLLDDLGAREAELPTAARAAFAEVRACELPVRERLDATSGLADAGKRTRVHGDLHLGQILFTGDDFMLIDFEGEPARTLAERKAKRSPVVDVAGMLRSFHYAAVSVLRRRPESVRVVLAPWATFWNRAASTLLVRGWLAAIEGAGARERMLPADDDALAALVDFFVIEKAVYEVAYEMNNRPDWLDIPLEGVRELVVRPAGGAGGAAAPAPAASPAAPSPASLQSASSVAGGGGVSGGGGGGGGGSGSGSAGSGGGGRDGAGGEAAARELALFHEGKATRVHEVLGAHLVGGGGADFRVWAPRATEVHVVGDFNDWTRGATPLARTNDRGVFAAHVERARAGDRYKLIVGELEKSDPFARWQEAGGGGASIVCAPSAYAWNDDAWMRARPGTARRDRPLSIYEVHLGSWRRAPDAPERVLGYRELAKPLAEHARAHGFTHVELMPVLEHPFYGSWGYGVTGFFAPTHRYGDAVDLMYLVDVLHQHGVGVVFDWVPAHFARDPLGLAAFDGEPLFEPVDPARAVHPTWNTGLFDYGRPEVRSFLLSSASFWVDQFHADGLRVDGIESILYRDHGRAHVAERREENAEGVAFLRELTSTLKKNHPEAWLVAEDSSAWPGVTRSPEVGGLGFDWKWDMGFSHDMRRYLSIDPILRSREQGMLTFRAVYANKESWMLSLSHDDVVQERGGSLLAQMHGDRWQKLANLRVLYATAWAQQGKKLLFMGNELAEERAWHHDVGLDWALASAPDHAGIARMVGELNRLYREEAALHDRDDSPEGFEWIDGTNAQMSVIVFARKGASDDDYVIAACNYTPVPRYQYRIGVPRIGRWREIFNSDAKDYGGTGHGNLGGVEAVPYPWNERRASIVVTLPPLGAIFLKRV